MGDIADEVLAHLVEQVDARDVAHHQQVIVIAEQGDLELQLQLFIHR